MKGCNVLQLWDAAVKLHRLRDRALLDTSIPMAHFTLIAIAYDEAAERAVDAMGGWLVVSTPQAVAHGRAR